MRSSAAALAEDSEPLTLSGQILSGLTALGQTATLLRMARGELICLQDGRGAGVHVLSRGRVKILRFSDEGRVMLLDLIEPGGVFGELSFLFATSTEGGPERGTEGGPSYAEAIDDTTVYSIPGQMFERLLHARPGLAFGIAGLLGERCQKLERRLEAHVFHRVPTRLVNQLLELAERYGVEHEGKTLLSIGLSQQDLGNLIGASREIVSLTLSDLKKRGLVDSKGRRLLVHVQRLRDELSRTVG